MLHAWEQCVYIERNAIAMVQRMKDKGEVTKELKEMEGYLCYIYNFGFNCCCLEGRKEERRGVSLLYEAKQERI